MASQTYNFGRWARAKTHLLKVPLARKTWKVCTGRHLLRKMRKWKVWFKMERLTRMA